MSQNKDLNTSPYFDDFDSSKKFHKILFVPSRALQAREVTQLQSILQDQIEKFGDHIFVAGTIVKGCAFNFLTNYPYIKIQDNAVDGKPINLGQYSNSFVVSTSNLSAIVMNSIAGLESQNPDLNTLYIRYTNVGNNGEKEFANNETLTVYASNYSLQTLVISDGGTGYSNSDYLTFTSATGSGANAIIQTNSNGTITSATFTSQGNNYLTSPSVSVSNSSNQPSSGTGAAISALNYISQIKVAANTIATAGNTATYPTGRGYGFKINDGIIFQKGFFIEVDSQEIIVDKYSTSPNEIVVGIDVLETIANSSTDTTLLDNASGFDNENAPGADRLVLTPTLKIKTPAEALEEEDFFTLVEFKNGRIFKQKQDTEYNELGNEFAKRTFEESGDYVVRPFEISSESITGNTTHINTLLSSGLAYVNGHRVQQYSQAALPVKKGTTSREKTNQTITTNYGNYVIVDEFIGMMNFQNIATVSLRSAARNSITTKSFTYAAPGSEIGTAKVRSVEYHSGTPGTATAQYRVYIFDIKMNPGYNFNQTKAISYSSGDYSFVCDAVLTNSLAQIIDSNKKAIIFPFGKSAIKTLRNESNENNTVYNYRTVNSSSSFSSGAGELQITITGDEYFPYSTGNLSSTEENDFIVMMRETVNSADSFSGTVTYNISNTGVVGSGTSFITEYNVGDHINVNSETRQIVSISNNTFLNVDSVFSANASANVHVRQYPAFRAIDFTVSGRNISIDSSQQSLTLNLNETLATSANAYVVFNTQKNPATQLTKNINKDIFVKIDCSNNSATNIGPWSLGLPDIHKITGIYKGNSYSESQTNVTSNFELVNGQTDTHYGISHFRLKPSSSLSIASDDKILVKCEVFSHTTSGGGGGFFSVDSYPVDDTTEALPSDKIRTQDISLYKSEDLNTTFDLRDCVDFRPIVANTATIATTIENATINPTSVETFTNSEKYIPTTNDQFQADLQFYLSRIDKVVINSYGEFKIIEGVSDENPYPPSQVQGGMTIATLTIPPFPTLAADQALSSSRSDYTVRAFYNQTKRMTMKEINGLKKRIENLEYYTSLNLLEKKTQDLVIPSEINSSVNRFKNGIFVDNFRDFRLSNFEDSEFFASIDTGVLELKPPFAQQKFDLENGANTNLTQKGDIVMLDYTNEVFIEQLNKTRFRNCVENYWNFVGKMFVSPEYDNFVDTKTNPQNNITINVDDPNLASTLTQVENLNAQSPINMSTRVSIDDSTDRRTSGRAEVNTTTTTTTTTSSQEVFEANITETLQNVGDFVRDVQFSPFIREQTITIDCFGLRPNARVYVFFDKKNITNSVSVTKLTNPVWTGSSTQEVRRGWKDEMPRRVVQPGDVKVDSLGGFTARITIPANTFFVGEREIIVTDVDDYDNIDTATTLARGRFNAYNFSVEKSNLMISTRSAEIESRVVSNTNVTQTTRQTLDWPDIEWMFEIDPIAQTFRVPNSQTGNDDGVFITEIDVAFKKKDSTKGVMMELRETVNGFPSKTVLPFGRTRLNSSDITVSDNGSAITTFKFPSPVFVKTGLEYTFVVLPEGNSPDYQIFTAKNGQEDLETGFRISRDWGNGVMFQSTNNSAWNDVQDEDIFFKIKIAAFNQTSGTLQLQNEDYEFLTIANTNGTFSQGEKVFEYKTTANLTGGVSFSSNSTTITGTGTSFINFIDENDYIVVVNSNTSPTNISLLRVESVANNTVLTVHDLPTFSANNMNYFKTVVGVATYFDTSNNELILTDSNAANSTFLFASNTILIGSDSLANCSVVSVDNKKISYFQPLIYRTSVTGTSLSLSTKIANSSLGYNSTNQNKFNTTNFVSDESVIASRSNEIVNASGNKSFIANVEFTSSSKYISPVIDLQASSILFYKNLINNSANNENTRSGDATVKYISKNVVLGDGQDAEDFRAYITAYKPPGTNIKVYVKILNSFDNESFTSKKWVELEQKTSKTVVSDLSNTEDFKEFEFKFYDKIQSEKISGVGNIDIGSGTLNGVETTFDDLEAGKIIVLTNPQDSRDFEVFKISSVTSNTEISVTPNASKTFTGATLGKVSCGCQAFRNPQNDNIIRYFGNTGGVYDSYKVFAVKIVLLSENDYTIPRVKDLRCLAMTI